MHNKVDKAFGFALAVLATFAAIPLVMIAVRAVAYGMVVFVGAIIAGVRMTQEAIYNSDPNELYDEGALYT